MLCSRGLQLRNIYTRYSNYMLHIADSWPGTTFRGYRGKRGLSFRDRLLQDLCLDFALLRDEILCAGFFWSLIVFSRDAERHEDSTNIEVVHWKFNWCFSIIIWSIGIVCQRGQYFDNFCMPIPCCPMNWSISIFIWSIRIFN